MKHPHNYQSCPFCGAKVSFLKKRFFMNTIYSYTCPNCGEKMKVKRIGVTWCLIICAVIIMVAELQNYHDWIVWVVLVIYMIISNIQLYYAELIKA